MSHRAKAPAKRAATPSASTHHLVETSDGALRLSCIMYGREYRTTIPADGSLRLSEVADLCGVERSTVYRWTHKTTQYTYRPVLHAPDGIVALPELRRFFKRHGDWWMKGKGYAGEIAATGPVAEPRK